MALALMVYSVQILDPLSCGGAMKTEPSQNMLTPIGDIGSTAGYTGVPSNSTSDKSAAIAQKYRQDSLLSSKLTDRVYQLLQEDLYLQRERLNNYGCSR
jgi:hypothetical protein